MVNLPTLTFYKLGRETIFIWASGITFKFSQYPTYHFSIHPKKTKTSNQQRGPLVLEESNCPTFGSQAKHAYKNIQHLSSNCSKSHLLFGSSSFDALENSDVFCFIRAPSPSLFVIFPTTSKTGYSSPFFGESEWSDDYRPINWLKMWPNRWRVNDPFVAFETDWFCLPRKNIAGSWSFFLTIRSDLWTRNHWTQDKWFQFLLTLHPEKIHFEPKVIQVDGSDVFPFQKRVIFRFKPNLVPVWGFVLFDGSNWLSPKQHWTQFEMSGSNKISNKHGWPLVFLQFRSFFEGSCLLFLKTCLD